MTNALADQINASFRNAKLPHQAVFVPSDDPEATDDEIEIRLNGAATPFGVQVSNSFGGYDTAMVTEHGRDPAGEINSVTYHGEFAQAKGAEIARKIILLLQKAT